MAFLFVSNLFKASQLFLLSKLEGMDDFLSGRQSLREFLSIFDIDTDELPKEMRDRLLDPVLTDEVIWEWCRLGLLHGRSQRATPILCSLLVRSDHEGHEDLADTLQDLRDPRTVDILSDCANRRMPYLEYNDSFQLARKCVWALHDIGTPEAVAKLHALCDDPRELVACEAMDRLKAIKERGSDYQEIPYRIARDSSLGNA